MFGHILFQTKDSTLYAKFEPKEYTTTNDTLGGSEIESITLPFGSKVDAPVETPEKEGFNFVGWFLDAEGTEPVDFDTLTMPIDGLTIYAVWVDASIKYTVSFELNGGTGTAQIKKSLQEIKLQCQKIQLKMDLSSKVGM